MLMDEVHACIESKNIKFILTGSSARKLKNSHTSLMAGRARRMYFHPLVSKEIGNFDLKRILHYGTIPSVYLSDEPFEDLRDYAGMYLKEEIQAEALVRKIDGFSRFLDVAALTNSQLINYESIAVDAQVPARTIREYYALLQDTLIGSMLNPVKSTAKRKSIATGKFYFFDIGVVNSILGRKTITPKSSEFGAALEHFIFLEIKAYIDYFATDSKIEFWRADRESEVDFVLNEDIAIEVKSSNLVHEKHIKGLQVFSKKGPCQRQIVVSLDSEPRKIGKVDVLPVKLFLEMLWEGEII
jgi:predicted AAA+ superfamily ATPase